MNTPDRSSARKQRRNHNSPYSRKASKPKAALDPLPTLASSSSFRNLYNFVSSPFRSRAAPPPPQDESDEDEDEDEEDGVEDRPIELGDSDEDMDQQQDTSSWKGKGREVDGNPSGGLTRSSASSNLSSLPPLPNPNSSKWISALAPSSTHAHALVQMAPSSQVSQPRYAKQPMGPPPPPPPRGAAGGISRSQTLSSLQPGASSSSNSSSTSTRAELILERFLAEKGLSEEDEREVRELMVKKGRESEVPPPPSNHSTTYNPPLFHPGTSATRLAASTSTNTLANSRLARSTSTMSFLSPSRSSSSSQLSSSSSSRQLNARASSPGAFSSPGKRRPIYLGPGVSHSPSRSKRNVTFGGLDLKPSVVVQSPGKKRRVEDDREDDDMDVERELSGLGSSSSSGRGLSSSQSVPSFLNSAPASPASPSSPFTFSIPFSPSSSSSSTTNNSISQPAALSPSPARALAPPPPPAPVVKPSQSLSSGLSRYSRHPSLVAPSPLRQSTSFAESPESVKSSGGSPAGSPLGAKGASGAGAGGARSKASSMMLDFIQEEEVAKRVASPTPISNPYQSAGLASPSPRRNPRRSVAAETRSSRAATPRKGANGDGLKVPTALELIEKEAQKESMNSPTPTSKKQKSSATSSSNSDGHSLNGPSTPSRLSASPAPPNDSSTTPTSAPPPKRKAPAEDAPPSWMTDVQPPTVIFAHDAFGGPLFGSGSKKSTTSFGSAEDSEMDESTSPAKSTTTNLFTSSVDSREKIVEKDFGKKPSFAFDTTVVSSPSSKKSTLPSKTSTSKSVNPTSSSSSSKSSDPKTIALETDRVLLPNFTFIFSSITTPLPTSSLESQAISEVTKLPSTSLPKFDLLAPPPPPASTSTSTGGFNWASAGLAPPPKPSADIWTCGTCGTKSPLAKEKCIACEEPKPSAVKKTSPSSSSNAPAPVVGGFNWASAGMAPPPKPSSDIWTCDVCGIKSPLDKAKCIACEEPRPVQKSTPAPPPVVASGGFNWAASGFAPPPAPSSDVWVCGDCGTKSPKEKEKCIACEAPNPTKKSTTSAPVGGFNWGAAGMKVPEKKAGWECGVCMIRNGEERTKCASCETERS